MEKHTPGPWVAIESHFGFNIRQQENLNFVVDAGDCGAITRTADARLVTAAPELLEALELAFGFYDRLLLCSPPRDAWGFYGAEAKARAAIAKAKGEE